MSIDQFVENCLIFKVPLNGSGGGGGGSITLNGDTGFVTGTNFTISTGFSTETCGASVRFVASGSTLGLQVTDPTLSATFIGLGCGSFNNTGMGSTGVGANALSSLAQGYEMTCIGSGAGFGVIGGYRCFYGGSGSGASAVSGFFNSGVGHNSCRNMSIGNNNNAFGASALMIVTNGIGNNAFGNWAGYNYSTTESYNICIGDNVRGVTGESNTLRIGLSTGTQASQLNRAFIAGITSFTQNYAPTVDLPVTIDLTTGQLGVQTSVTGTGAMVFGTAPTITLPNATGLPLSTGVTGVLPIANGGTGVTSVTTTPTANAFAGWDANTNFLANNLTLNQAVVTSSAGTTNLTVSSANSIIVIGTQTHSINLPVTSTIRLGTRYRITNFSTGSVGVFSSGGNLVATLPTNAEMEFENINQSVTTAGGWSVAVLSTISSGDTGTNVGVSLNLNAGTASRRCGSTVSFTASGNALLLNLANTALSNMFIGTNCGTPTVTGANNTGFGVNCMAAVTGSAGGNTGYGALCLTGLTTGGNNTVVGQQAGAALTTQGNSVAIGAVALNKNNAGFGQNTAIGFASLTNLLSGVNNVGVGANTGTNYNGSESHNILIGTNVTGTAAESNTLRIGLATGTASSQINRTFIQGIHSQSLTPSSTVRMVNVDNTTGQLGVATPLGFVQASQNLTTGTAATVLAVATTTNSVTGGQLSYVVRVGNGTNFQAASGIVNFTVANTGGTITANVVLDSLESKVQTNGTLSISFSFAAGTSNLQITSVSTLPGITSHTVTCGILNLY